MNLKKRAKSVSLALCTIMLSGHLAITADAMEKSYLEESDTYICTDVDCESERSTNPEERFSIASVILNMAKLYIKSVDTFKSLHNWYKADPKGYNRWVDAYNKGGNHCRNMCPSHKSINPYNYGYKDKYNA